MQGQECEAERALCIPGKVNQEPTWKKQEANGVLPRRPRGTGHQSQGSLLPGLHSTGADGTGKAGQRPDDLCPETCVPWHT